MGTFVKATGRGSVSGRMNVGDRVEGRRHMRTSGAPGLGAKIPKKSAPPVSALLRGYG